MTLETQELSSLPMAGRNMLALISLAPGVSGLGLAGGPGVSSGTPGTGVDNYSTETAVDVSVNGQGTVANMWIVDGLDVTSAIRQGVLNLTPNPDAIQETNIQVNTFSVGRSEEHTSELQSLTNLVCRLLLDKKKKKKKNKKPRITKSQYIERNETQVAIGTQGRAKRAIDRALGRKRLLLVMVSSETQSTLRR